MYGIKPKDNNNNFEATLFNTTDKLRKNIDAAEYKNVGKCGEALSQ